MVQIGSVSAGSLCMPSTTAAPVNRMHKKYHCHAFLRRRAVEDWEVYYPHAFTDSALFLVHDYFAFGKRVEEMGVASLLCSPMQADLVETVNRFLIPALLSGSGKGCFQEFQTQRSLQMVNEY